MNTEPDRGVIASCLACPIILVEDAGGTGSMLRYITPGPGYSPGDLEGAKMCRHRFEGDA